MYGVAPPFEEVVSVFADIFWRTQGEVVVLRAIRLVKQGVISAEDALEAIEKHLQSRPPLGQIALEKTKLSMKQVFRLLDMQSTSGRPFGQIAVCEGYMSEADLSALLMEQGNRARPVLHILTEMGAITPEQMLQSYAENPQQVESLVLG